MKKGKETGKAKKGSPTGASKTSQSHPAGHGGKAQQAGGPEHKGAGAREDKNP